MPELALVDSVALDDGGDEYIGGLDGFTIAPDGSYFQADIQRPRVLHFSNPNVNYGGAPTGTAAQHDNARSINQTASTVANFRQSVSGGSGTAPTISPTHPVWNSGGGSPSPDGWIMPIRPGPASASRTMSR